MIGDLHCHTRLSDGSSSIDDVIFYAKRAGLSFIALTDHETMDSVGRACVLGKRYGLRVIPGVELSCRDYARNRDIQLLCYLPDKPDRLQRLMGHILEGRRQAGQLMLREVMRYFPITEEHVARYSLGSKAVYKAHMMQALMDLGYDNEIYGKLYQQLFCPNNGTCYYPVSYPDVYEVLENIHDAGGLAVFAHPCADEDIELVDELTDRELIHGLEAYHPKHGDADSQALEALAERYGLICTGGSDFHGYWSKNPQPLAGRIVGEACIKEMFRKKKALSLI